MDETSPRLKAILEYYFEPLPGQANYHPDQVLFGHRINALQDECENLSTLATSGSSENEVQCDSSPGLAHSWLGVWQACLRLRAASVEELCNITWTTPWSPRKTVNGMYAFPDKIDVENITSKLLRCLPKDSPSRPFIVYTTTAHRMQVFPRKYRRTEGPQVSSVGSEDSHDRGGSSDRETLEDVENLFAMASDIERMFDPQMEPAASPTMPDAVDHQRIQMLSIFDQSFLPTDGEAGTTKAMSRLQGHVATAQASAYEAGVNLHPFRGGSEIVSESVAEILQHLPPGSQLRAKLDQWRDEIQELPDNHQNEYVWAESVNEVSYRIALLDWMAVAVHETRETTQSCWESQKPWIERLPAALGAQKKLWASRKQLRERCLQYIHAIISSVLYPAVVSSEDEDEERFVLDNLLSNIPRIYTGLDPSDDPSLVNQIFGVMSAGVLNAMFPGQNIPGEYIENDVDRAFKIFTYIVNRSLDLYDSTGLSMQEVDILEDCWVTALIGFGAYDQSWRNHLQYRGRFLNKLIEVLERRVALLLERCGMEFYNSNIDLQLWGRRSSDIIYRLVWALLERAGPTFGQEDRARAVELLWFLSTMDGLPQVKRTHAKYQLAGQLLIQAEKCKHADREDLLETAQDLFESIGNPHLSLNMKVPELSTKTLHSLVEYPDAIGLSKFLEDLARAEGGKSAGQGCRLLLSVSQTIAAMASFKADSRRWLYSTLRRVAMPGRLIWDSDEPSLMFDLGPWQTMEYEAVLFGMGPAKTYDYDLRFDGKKIPTGVELECPDPSRHSSGLTSRAETVLSRSWSSAVQQTRETVICPDHDLHDPDDFPDGGYKTVLGTLRRNPRENTIYPGSDVHSSDLETTPGGRLHYPTHFRIRFEGDYRIVRSQLDSENDIMTRSATLDIRPAKRGATTIAQLWVVTRPVVDASSLTRLIDNAVIFLRHLKAEAQGHTHTDTHPEIVEDCESLFLRATLYTGFIDGDFPIQDGASQDGVSQDGIGQESTSQDDANDASYSDDNSEGDQSCGEEDDDSGWSDTPLTSHGQVAKLYAEALVSGGDPLYAIHAGQRLFDWLLRDLHMSSALIAVKSTATLYHQALFHGIASSDKQFMVRELAAIEEKTIDYYVTGGALLAYLLEESPMEGLKLLELGRGITTASIFEIRPKGFVMRKLREEQSELAEKLEQYRNLVKDKSISRTDRDTAASDLVSTMRSISDDPGFEDLLGYPSQSDITTMLASGAVVILFASQILNQICLRAIIIDNSGDMSWMTFDAANTEEAERRSLTEYLKPGIEKLPPEDMQDLLEWLWVYIADPILQKLGFTETPAEGGWERLCWIPIGRLSKLPLHAAGIHKGRGGYSVLDRVVSSYATSVKSLISIRKDKPRARQSSEVEVLLVSMENTPRLGRLYYAAQEVEAVREICTRHAIRTKQPPSLKEDVMRSLGTCTIFHFAGHGEVDVWDPTKSRLLLSDWEKPNKSFDVGSLVDDELGLQENPPHVAYLSACKTAQTDDQISDEGLHLVGAFQLAGFRHVIGTLWSVADDTCKAMAEVMYEELFAKGLNDDNAVAWALHKAMRTCRDAWRKTSTMNTTRSDVTKAPEKDHKGRQGMRESREDTNIKVLSEAIGIKDFSLGEERGRDVGDGEDMPLNWVPYVHYGP